MLKAARLGDQITHSQQRSGLIGGMIVGALVGAALVAGTIATVLTGGLALAPILLIVGAVGTGAAVGGGSVWVTSRYDRTVERIDPVRGTVVARVHLDSPPQGVLFAGDRIWVTTHS